MGGGCENPRRSERSRSSQALSPYPSPTKLLAMNEAGAKSNPEFTSRAVETGPVFAMAFPQRVLECSSYGTMPGCEVELSDAAEPHPGVIGNGVNVKDAIAASASGVSTGVGCGPEADEYDEGCEHVSDRMPAEPTSKVDGPQSERSPCPILCRSREP